MKASQKRLHLILGIVFLLGAPLCFVGASAYAYFQPRLFRASTVFSLQFPQEDGPGLQNVFKQAEQKYPERLDDPVTARVSMEPTGTPGQFRVSAVSPDPMTSSLVANWVTVLIGEILRDSSKGAHSRRTEITVKAEPPRQPSLPDVPLIMARGVKAALACGGLGVVFLILAHRQRKSDVPDIPAK
jgi:uncharacterized protein involved in exopolysaccharide biosynthesis